MAQTVWPRVSASNDRKALDFFIRGNDKSLTCLKYLHMGLKYVACTQTDARYVFIVKEHRRL